MVAYRRILAQRLLEFQMYIFVFCSSSEEPSGLRVPTSWLTAYYPVRVSSRRMAFALDRLDPFVLTAVSKGTVRCCGAALAYNFVMRRIESNLRYRPATADDIPLLGPLIEASVRGLSAREYSRSQIEQALGTWLGLDTRLIADGTYYVVEPAGEPGVLAACGGWSRRRTPYGSDHGPGRDDALLDPGTEAAKIRAFFVHPDWARRGIGSRLLEMCEAAAWAEGFSRCEMGATLPGVPLYRRHGYAEGERIELPLANGETLPVVKMEKWIR